MSQPPPSQIPKDFLEDPEVRKFMGDFLRTVYLLWEGMEKNVGFYGGTPVIQGSSLTAALTAITHIAPGTPDYALQNLTSTSPFGFVSQDEGNTVLSIIANLQTRVNELESRLDSSTGIGVFE